MRPHWRSYLSVWYVWIIILKGAEMSADRMFAENMLGQGAPYARLYTSRALFLRRRPSRQFHVRMIPRRPLPFR